MGILTRAVARVVPDEIKTRRTAPGSGTAVASTILSQRRQRRPNAQFYREWAANNPWIRGAFDMRNGQLQRADWDLVPFDREGPTPDKGLMRRIREVLEQPNPADPSFATFIAAVAEDTLVLDAGSIEKERMLRGEIAYLWPTDGARVLVDRFWDGNPRTPRYFWERSPSPEDQIGLLNSDLTYVKIHNRSYSGIGMPYLETLKTVVDAELAVMLFNVRNVKQAAPDGIMDLGENARKDQVEAFKAFWDAEIAGQGVMSFWGGTKGAKFIDLHKSNKDQQMMEFTTYLLRAISVVCQISIQDLQLIENVNKSNGEVLQENTEDRGFRTLAGTVQDYLTSEVCWDPGWGGRANNIAFRYKAVSDRSSLAKAQTQKLTLAGMPSESINEARIARGLPPIGDPADTSNPYNQLMASTSQGLVTLAKIPTAYELAMRTSTAPADGGDTADSGDAKPPLRRVKSDEFDPGQMVIDPELEPIASAIKAVTGPEED